MEGNYGKFPIMLPSCNLWLGLIAGNQPGVILVEELAFRPSSTLALMGHDWAVSLRERWDGRVNTVGTQAGPAPDGVVSEAWVQAQMRELGAVRTLQGLVNALKCGLASARSTNSAPSSVGCCFPPSRGHDLLPLTKTKRPSMLCHPIIAVAARDSGHAWVSELPDAISAAGAHVPVHCLLLCEPLAMKVYNDMLQKVLLSCICKRI